MALTLIELLVVVAIILLLASILLPALKSARLKGRIASCLSSMRQMGLGWHMYADDSEGYYPQNYMEGGYFSAPSGNAYYYSGYQLWMSCDPWPTGYLFGGSAATSRFSGIGHVYPYVKSASVFYCPANVSSPDRLQKTWYAKGTVTDPNDPSGTAQVAANTYYGFGVQGKGTLSTYWYRGGMYPMPGDPPGTISGHGGPNGSAPSTPRKVGDPNVNGRVMMTDYWRGGPGVTTPPHGTEASVAILATDGYAAKIKLPGAVLPLWGYYDSGAYTKGTYNSLDPYLQLPAWWLFADDFIR